MVVVVVVAGGGTDTGTGIDAGRSTCPDHPTRVTVEGRTKDGCGSFVPAPSNDREGDHHHHHPTLHPRDPHHYCPGFLAGQGCPVGCCGSSGPGGHSLRSPPHPSRWAVTTRTTPPYVGGDGGSGNGAGAGGEMPHQHQHQHQYHDRKHPLHLLHPLLHPGRGYWAGPRPPGTSSNGEWSLPTPHRRPWCLFRAHFWPWAGTG